MSDLDLTPFKENIEALRTFAHGPEGSWGSINTACWLGENAHHLVAEIERSRTENALLLTGMVLAVAATEALGLLRGPSQSAPAIVDASGDALETIV